MKRILVISDTHGMNKEVLESILEVEKADLIIHLGDYVEDGEKIANTLGLPYIIVKGNGDFKSKYPEERIIDIEGKKIFLTHGHKYDVRSSLDRIYYRASELDTDIAIFGHSHIAINTEENGIILFNPGSPSLPRGIDRIKSYGVIRISEEIDADIVRIK